ncbi:glycosyltransferase [Micromonospora sp. R77]|uniref:glycosyltransferase family 4 protein n=1 Tax=Micromonospora sp. R77 TaxID=2925836 RepID=UPI001F6032B3|nr:glycosyltransferase [Micromonospora sp. R77]MCI4065256.1 glycosyltransferase [Micromonospora sp. R77]
MKILMVGPFPVDTGAPTGGVEAATVNLVTGLAGIDGVRLEILANAGPAVREHIVEHPFGRVHYLPCATGYRGWLRDLHGRFVRAARQEADVVHVQGCASVAARLPRSVLTVHGIAERDTLLTRSGPGRLPRTAAAIALEGLPRRRVRRVIAISAHVERRVGRPDRLWRIPNAIDPTFFAGVDQPSAGDPDLFLWLGRMTPLKDVAGLVRAFRAVASASGSARLVVAGSGMDTGYAGHCRQLAARLGLRRVVTFLGQQSVTGTAGLLREAGTLVLFSRQENAPMVIAEALASGRGVVATEVGGIPEMVQGLPGCHLVRPRDEAALADRLLRRCHDESTADVAARRQAARRFDPAHVARATHQAYAEIVAADRGTPRRRVVPRVDAPAASHGRSR